MPSLLLISALIFSNSLVNLSFNSDLSILSFIYIVKSGRIMLEESLTSSSTLTSDLAKENLSKYLNVLGTRELEIIKMRYGLLNTNQKTQKEIAKKLHISRSYVSRIEKRALIKMLREFIRNNNI